MRFIDAHGRVAERSEILTLGRRPVATQKWLDESPMFGQFARTQEDGEMVSNSRSTTMGMTRVLGLATTLASASSSCVDEDIDAPSNYETGDASGSGGMCEPVAQDGEWDPVLVEWSDPGEPGDPPKVGYEDM